MSVWVRGFVVLRGLVPGGSSGLKSSGGDEGSDPHRQAVGGKIAVSDTLINPNDIRRYLIAVDAPAGAEFTVYAEDQANKIRFQQNIVWVSEYPHRGMIYEYPPHQILS